MVSEDIKQFLTYSANKDAVLVSDSHCDDDLPNSINKNEHSESECSEDIFHEEINDGAVEIRIRNPKNVDHTKSNNIDFKNRDIVMDVEQSKNHVFLREVKEELVKDEMSFEEDNLDFKGFSFEDENWSSISKTSLVAVSEHHSVKVETTEGNTLPIPSNKMIKLEKSLTIPLIDCQSYLNITKITTENEKITHPQAELSTNNPPTRIIKSGACKFMTSSKATMSRHMERHILYNDTGNKCPNCRKVYRNPDILEEHIQSCEGNLRNKLSSKKFSAVGNKCPNCQKLYRNPDVLKLHIQNCGDKSRKIVSSEKLRKTTQPISNRLILQHPKKEKCDNIQLRDNIEPNKTTECDQNEAVAAKPATNLKETSLETLKKLVYHCSNCTYKTTFHSKYVVHLKKVHKSIICDICAKAFKANIYLKRHLLRHCEDKKFVCYLCQKGFKTKGEVSLHQITHRTDRNYICDICHKAFKSYNMLNKHQITHRTDRNFMCDICEKAFKANKYLKHHRLIIHCQDRKFTCDFCPKEYKTKGELSRHQVTHRTELISKTTRQIFKRQILPKKAKCYGEAAKPATIFKETSLETFKVVCNICQKRFKTKVHLSRHQQVTHSTNRNYICDICEKAFKSNANLKLHRLIHCEDKKFTCDLCQKGFKTKCDLNKHQVTHRTDRNYICDICHKAFKSYKVLNNHQITHRTERNYICDICEQAFKTYNVLILHQRTHSDERKFACDVCQKGFKTKRELKPHQVTHSTDRNYICDICQKAFKTRVVLRLHMKVHCDVRNYICHICQKGFKYQAILTSHIQTHRTQK